ncbi:hypothetical protein Hanom_Chr08g00744551 [Helianthus anomalus]
MARQPRLSSDDSTPTFMAQNLLQNSKWEICTYDNAYIAALRSSGIFPDSAIFWPFDRDLRSDVSSNELYHGFFRTTGLSFNQTMPMVWRVLVVLDCIKNNHIPDICVNDLPVVYRLSSHGSSRFLFYSTTNNPLILRATRNKEEWKTKFFFVKRSSIPSGEIFPVKWLTKAEFRKPAPPTPESVARIESIYKLLDIERSFLPNQATSIQHSSSNMSESAKIPIVFDLEELDSYSGLVQVKQETPAATSCKPSAPPTPTPQPRARASVSKKRKGSDTANAAPESFFYEELGFVDFFEPMTSFLNKVNILTLYPVYTY